MKMKKTSHKSDNVQALQKKKLSSLEKYSSNNVVDKISLLPDDILVSILSLLTFRVATATTILSTRWRRLHAMLHVVLLKCPFTLQPKEGDNHGYYQLGDETHFSDYINWINHTLDSYTGSKVIKKFRVYIPYTKEKVANSDTNNKLLEFALSRETEIIEIHVVYSTKHVFCLESTYDFSTWIIKNGSKSSSSILPGLKCLKELSLSGVALYNNDIRVLLSNLVILERLLLESSNIKPYFPEAYDDRYEPNIHIDIKGPPSSKLKHLTISNVSREDTIISDLKNLISLRCDGMHNSFPIALINLPKLLHLRVHTAKIGYILQWRYPDIYCDEHVKLQHLHLFVELRKYKISGDEMFSTKNTHVFSRQHLKHLEINVVVDKEYCNLHQLFSLMEACPRLKKLKMKLIWSSCKPEYKHRRLDEERVNTTTTIDYLNTIKLSGFCGSIPELEFVLCVINNGMVLEELVVESCVTNCAIKQKEIARSFKHLINVAPSCVDLILK